MLIFSHHIQSHLFEGLILDFCKRREQFVDGFHLALKVIRVFSPRSVAGDNQVLGFAVEADP